MTRFILVIAILIFQGCATSYQSAVRTNYIGNDQHEISANGNGYTKDDQVRQYLYRAAFETCQKEGKGFELMGQEDTTSTKLGSADFGAGLQLFTARFPGGRMVIKCNGPIDERMQREVSSVQ